MNNCNNDISPMFLGCFPSCKTIATKLCFKETGYHTLYVHFAGNIYEYKIYGISGAKIHLSNRFFNENGISSFQIKHPSGDMLTWSELDDLGVMGSECACDVFKLKLEVSYTHKPIPVEEFFCPEKILCCPDVEEELEISIIHNYIPNNRPPIDDWIATLIPPDYCNGVGDVRWTFPDGTTRECVYRVILPENGEYTVEFFCKDTGCSMFHTFDFNEI